MGQQLRIGVLVGEVERVSGDVTNVHGHDGIEDVATTTIRFANGEVSDA